MTDDQPCFVCQKQRGEVHVPGGILYQNDLVAINHAQIRDTEKEHYLGHLFVETRRHVAGLDELTEEEAREIGAQVRRAAAALKSVLQVEHVYAFAIIDGCPHVHIHVIGRYPGAPRDYWGCKVDEWPEAPKGGEVEIGELADLLREALRA